MGWKSSTPTKEMVGGGGQKVGGMLRGGGGGGYKLFWVNLTLGALSLSHADGGARKVSTL